MSTLDEQVLSRRLHEDLDAVPAPAAPVGAVLDRGRSIRARRRAAAASAALMAGAAAVAVAVSAQPGNPAARTGAARTGAVPSIPARASTPPPAGALNSASPPGGTVFAAGRAGAAAWQLSLRNIGGGPSCLPAVMLDGTDGSLLPGAAHPSPAIIATAILARAPGLPGAGYAALQVAPAVTRLTAIFRDGTTLTVHPVSLRACGQQLHLAGFAYPVSGVARVTADSGGQFASTAREILPASLFHGHGLLRRPRPRAAGPAPGPRGLGARRRHATGHGIRGDRLWRTRFRPGRSRSRSGRAVARDGVTGRSG